MPDDGIVATRKEAARLLGVTERQLGSWVHEPWFPAGAVGADARGNNRDWNVRAIRAARDAMGRKGSDLADTAQKLKLKTDHEKLKQAQIKTQAEELKLRQQQGELIRRDALELFASTLLTSLGDWCDQLPDLIAAEVPRKYRTALKERLRTELDARRTAAAAELATAARDFDNRQQTEATDGEESSP